MKRRMSDLELCEKYRNENIHTEHVVRLGLRIFDRVAGCLKLTREDRRLFEVACRLHDVGYSVQPDGHAARSAGIVLDEGLTGYSAGQRALISGVILLHSSGNRFHRKASRAEWIKDLDRTYRLAAILRVADGLDHGHIQSVTVQSLKKRGNRLTLTVRDSVMLGNIESARRKSDLWNLTFPLPLEIRLYKKPASFPTRWGGVIRPADSSQETLRRLMCFLLRKAIDSIPSAPGVQDVEPIHDLRVALRRAGNLIRFFRKFLRTSDARRVRQLIRLLCDALGPVRDAQVWLEDLEQFSRYHRSTENRAWQEYAAECKAVAADKVRGIGRILHGHERDELFLRGAVLVRVYIAGLVRSEEPVPYRKYAARRLGKALKAFKYRSEILAGASAEMVHEIRRAARRARYAAEFAAPVLGVLGAELEHKLQKLSEVLGRIHDMDVQSERLRNHPFYASLRLERRISKERAVALIRAKRLMRRFQSNSHRQAIRTFLKRAARR
jgi:CHAD domain-containing protein